MDRTDHSVGTSGQDSPNGGPCTLCASNHGIPCCSLFPFRFLHYPKLCLPPATLNILVVALSCTCEIDPAYLPSLSLWLHVFANATGMQFCFLERMIVFLRLE